MATTCSTSSPSPHTMNIVIIGAGIGGLALAQGLRKHVPALRVDIFERKASLAVTGRTGYRIRVPVQGHRALHHVLSASLFQQHLDSSVSSESLPVFLDSSTLEKVPARGPLPPSSAPGAAPSPSRDAGTAPLRTSEHSGAATAPFAEVNRSVSRASLLQVLTADLPPDSLHYGRRFTRYESIEGGRVRVLFEDGGSVEADLLVAADGINSPVRQQLQPHIQLIDTTGRVIYTKLWLTNDAATSATLPAFVRDGMTGIRGGPAGPTLLTEKMAVSSPQQRDYLYVVFVAQSHQWQAGDDATLLKLSGSELLCVVQKAVSGWHPQVAALVSSCDAESTSITKVRTVVPFKPWASLADTSSSYQPSVVLLGDALHPMTPIGLGATCAMEDAVLLVSRLVAVQRGEQSISTALRAYQTEAITRAMLSVRLAQRGGAHMFGQAPLPEEDVNIDQAGTAL